MLGSSSEIIRRIDARISSIEGSWTFAGCVISDSTSKPSYTKPRRIRRFRICRPGFSSPQARLVPRSTPPDSSRGADSPKTQPDNSAEDAKKAARIALLIRERYVRGTIDCKRAPPRPSRCESRSLGGVPDDDATPWRHDPEKWKQVLPRDKRGTRLRGDHCSNKS